ncbi:MAG: hypothetical protein QGH42_05480 [Kiritimatiellia bacterium]|jgi:hypothetical protein|nr:hypothetical protein [Kiritimatiellia bacterium]MDP6631864.1 hypothetical protein [Kiritimatiellia bacterium]MDP7023683.1 hypothetical protein [Kiritimatiellia bacterium]
MKTLITTSVVLLLCLSTTQARNGTKQRWGVGARYHVEHDSEREVPFDDVTTYGIVYEYHERGTFWQLGLQYGTEIGGVDVDYVLTPEINLMLTDGAWRGGIGALSTYVKVDDESDWSDVYYQFILGFDMPLGSTILSIQANYAFEDFDKLDEFDFDELDWVGYLMYEF